MNIPVNYTWPLGLDSFQSVKIPEVTNFPPFSFSITDFQLLRILHATSFSIPNSYQDMCFSHIFPHT